MKEEKKQQDAQQPEKSVSIKESEYLTLKEDAAKAAGYWDKLLRLQAEFENTRKRLEKEKQDFIKFANEGILIDLLNVLDDLERSLDVANAGQKDVHVFLKGVEMVLAHLYDLLKDYGIKPIEAVGKIFDPHYHEALAGGAQDLPEHTVIEELQGIC
jgi:molecular chaperone GrpE